MDNKYENDSEKLSGQDKENGTPKYETFQEFLDKQDEGIPGCTSVKIREQNNEQVCNTYKGVYHV